MAIPNIGKLSDEQVETKRAEIHKQIELLRADFKELGLELERRRKATDLPALEAQRVALETQIASIKTAAIKGG